MRGGYQKLSVIEGILNGENCMKKVTKAGMYMPDFRIRINYLRLNSIV